MFEFFHTNVRGTYKFDESKGLVERVYVEAPNAESANEYMASLGVDFEDDCHCCGRRWVKATAPMPEDDHIDVRYFKTQVAVHYISGSFVIWTPQEYRHYAGRPKPKAHTPHGDAIAALEAHTEPDKSSFTAYQASIRRDPITEEFYVEEERIAKANEPRYNALPPEDEMREIAYAKAELLSAIDKNTARKAQAETRFAIREHIDAMYELIDKL